jgi:beta-galactosidase/beta-glucuronidase
LRVRPLTPIALLLALAVPSAAQADLGGSGDQAPLPGPAAKQPGPAPAGVPSPFTPAPPERNFGSTSGGVARAAGDDLPDTQTLTDGWEFRLGPTLDESATDWQQITVPHVMDQALTPEAFKGEVGWYRLRFDAPDAPTGFAFALRFNEVRREADVYLNGKKIGSNRDPYTPFVVPANGLRKGEENELTVRVSNVKGTDPREGWWNWGGIVRPVELIPQGRVTVDALGLLGSVTPRRDAATVTIDALVSNRTSRAVAPTLKLTLRSPSGKVTRTSFKLRRLAGKARRQERLEVPVKGRPELWSPTRPQLYDAKLVTSTNRVEQTDSKRIGLRRLEVTGGRILINGRPIQGRGAAYHEDLPGTGAALSDADIDKIVDDLKSVGATMTRVHYLFDERLLDRFDEEGILVWDEAPIWARDRQLKNAAGRKEALAQLKRTVAEARNHPSVFVNSVANELSNTPDKVSGTKAYIRDAAAMTRKVDPTTPVGIAMRTIVGTPKQKIYEKLDVIGFNHYLGWYPCPPAAQTNLDELPGFIDALRKNYPRQGIVMSEFGAEATRDGPETEKDTYAFQSEYVRKTIDIVDDHPYLGGAIYWALREFAVRPEWDGGACRPVDQDNALHRKGLLNYDGTKKPAWDVARRFFEDEPVLGSSR